jgi:hypothetical protein
MAKSKLPVKDQTLIIVVGIIAFSVIASVYMFSSKSITRETTTVPTTRYTTIPTTTEIVPIKTQSFEMQCIKENPDGSYEYTYPGNELIIEAPELVPSNSTFSATIKLKTVNECPYNYAMNLITWTFNERVPENLSQAYSYFVDSLIQKPGYTDIKTHTYVAGKYAFYLCAFIESPSGSDITTDYLCVSNGVKYVLKSPISLEECKARLTSWCTSCKISNFEAALNMGSDLQDCLSKSNLSPVHHTCTDVNIPNECKPYLPTS